jgi:hypothetical protein
MRGRGIIRVAWIALLLTASVLVAGKSRADTFDFFIWPYCAPGTFCGFASEQALIDRAEAAVHEDQSCLEDDYGVYEGQLGNWYSHAQVNCTDQDLSPLSEAIRAQPGNRYFLITTHDRTETPAGFDSSSQERPQAAPGQRCVTVQATAVCQ